MKLTFKEAIENHRKMWNWIADETEKRQQLVTKYHYFKENQIDKIEGGCYCCEYALNNSKVKFKGYVCKDCRICPIDWGIKSLWNDYEQCKYNTIYDRWELIRFSNDWLTAAKYARQIANLPVAQEQIKC